VAGVMVSTVHHSAVWHHVLADMGACARRWRCRGLKYGVVGRSATGLHRAFLFVMVSINLPMTGRSRALPKCQCSSHPEAESDQADPAQPEQQPFPPDGRTFAAFEPVLQCHPCAMDDQTHPEQWNGVDPNGLWGNERQTGPQYDGSETGGELSSPSGF